MDVGGSELPTIALLTREYPPDVYGGAGVHVEYLSRELSKLARVWVRCFGEPAGTRPGPPGADVAVESFTPWPEVAEGNPAPYVVVLQTLSVDLAMAAGLEGADLAHSHTWYANMAGHLAKLIYGIPHVMTSHSLEPLRPWKAEQLGEGGYAVSCFCERTAIEAADAVIAVSGAMREDILGLYPDIDPARVVVIHNGIDPEEYRPDPGTDVLEHFGIPPDIPAVVFVGRIARQKGITYFLDAAAAIDPDAMLVLCASAPDTEEIGREVEEQVQRVRSRRGGVVWIDRKIERSELIQILSHASVFVCPSIYEPLGIVNLEAMACEAPVVASATGGIPEVVVDGETGVLVPLEARDDGSYEPRDPAGFSRALAEAINGLLADPHRARAFGAAGRRRVEEHFAWAAVAERTLDLYRRLLRSERV